MNRSWIRTIVFRVIRSGCRVLVVFDSHFLVFRPDTEISDSRRVERDTLSSELVELGGSQNNLGGVDSRGKDTELGLLSSHVEAGNTGANRSSSSRGIVGHGSLGDHEGRSHLGVHSEGIGRRQDEGKEEENGYSGSLSLWLQHSLP